VHAVQLAGTRKARAVSPLLLCYITRRPRGDAELELCPLSDSTAAPRLEVASVTSCARRRHRAVLWLQGGVALTLLDALDAHLVFGDRAAFAAAAAALPAVTFDVDARVHVFELTIRCVSSSSPSGALLFVLLCARPRL
jgi:Glycosyl hydrolase family 47